MEKLRLRAERRPFDNRIELLAATNDGFVAQPLTMEKVEPGLFSPATMTIEANEAQELMDDLWRAGLRPSEGTGSAGAMAATEKHLRDMRDIAFHKLNIKQG